MYELKEARKIANNIKNIPCSNQPMFLVPVYNHVGATITDTILQAGLNYRTIVKPRVDRLIESWPAENTTTAFIELISKYSLSALINWNNSSKLARILRVTNLLNKEKLETEYEIANWLLHENCIDILRSFDGIGPKTIDYLKKLVGFDTIPIDRHLINYAIESGVTESKYYKLQKIYQYAADLSNMNYSQFDKLIWNYMSNKYKY